MKYIRKLPGILSHEECDNLRQIHTEYTKGGGFSPYKDLVFWRDKKMNPFIADKADDLDKVFKEEVNSYMEEMSFSKLSYKHTHLAGISITRQPDGHSERLHSDIELVRNKEGIRRRPFVFIIYLNKEYSGGQLCFPAQQEIITPEKGMGLFFPASYMFTHQILTLSGSDRYYLRMNYMFNPDCDEEDQDEYIMGES